MKLFSSTPRVALAQARWVVLDCETSGLDVARARLIAVGAVVIEGCRIDLSTSFDAVVRQETPSSADNILIHGIGGDAQQAGRRCAQVLAELNGFLGQGIPVAFHAPFDAAILRKACIGERQPAFKARWLDVAQLAPALYPARGASLRTLDDWLGAFQIECPARHEALGDAFATAELLLVLLDEAARQGARSSADVLRLARARRWLGSPQN